MAKRKPDAKSAMTQLLQQIETQIPLTIPEAEICAGKCIGCPKKLVNFLTIEMEHYQQQLASGETPLLGDISRLANIAGKVHKSFVRNGLIR